MRAKSVFDKDSFDGLARFIGCRSDLVSHCRRKKPPIRLAYATDLTDGQCVLIEPMIPQAELGGRPRKAATRELVDAILYFL